MICFPYAKINLGLSVLNKRSDGFHNIESLLHSIKLFDILEIIKSHDEDKFTLTGFPLDISPEQNIVWKAIQLLRSHYDFPKVKIHLHKQIPSGAGLGGGSSDAVHSILAINRVFNLGINQEILSDLALEIGSDCPFFVNSRPQYASGRGEILEPFELDLKPLKLLLIIPDFSVSTEFAYSKIEIEKHNILPKHALNQPIEKWKQFLKNDFENVFFKEYHVMAHLKEQMYQDGALYASLSGSGSALYGLFPQEIEFDLPDNYIFYWLNFPN